MHSLSPILELGEEEITRIQNIFLEAKTVNFVKLCLGGEYPFSPVMLQNLKSELSKKDPRLANLVKIAEEDPINLMRLISTAYSPVYYRANMVPSITSVIQQFGYRRLPQLIEDASSNSHSKSLTEFFSARASGLESLQRLIMTARLAKSIAAHLGGSLYQQEEAFLLGASNVLLRFALACFNPDLLCTWRLYSEVSGQGVKKTAEKLFIESEQSNLSDLLRRMSFPQRFLESIQHACVAPWNRRSFTKEQHERMHLTCSSAFVATEIVGELLSFNFESSFYNRMSDLSSKLSIDYDRMTDLVSELGVFLRSAEQSLSIKFPPLPPYLVRLSVKHQNVGEELLTKEPVDRVAMSKPYYAEIKTALGNFSNSSAPTFGFQAINLALNLLVKILDFDRATIFSYHPSKNLLKPELWFGRGLEELSEAEIKVEIGRDTVSPAVQSFFEVKAVFNGDPVFPDSWPFVAFPFARKGEILGVFYADCASKLKARPLSTEEQMALITLSELFII